MVPSEPRVGSRGRGISRELWLRLASAAVLIPLGLACVTLGGVPLAIISALVAAMMAFEWSRMAKSKFGPLMIAGAAGANLVFMVNATWALMVLVGVGALASLMGRQSPQPNSTLLGTIYAGGLPLALQTIRDLPEGGFVLAMGVMLFSWSSDSSAYFAGRTFKGPLLAPDDSPNKTWSGAIGAVVGSLAASIAYALLIGAPIYLWVILGLLVSAAAQIGDLFESQIKRQHAVKDTSGFLPGHGGVMDRLDGFGTACIAVVALVRLLPELPGQLAGG